MTQWQIAEERFLAVAHVHEHEGRAGDLVVVGVLLVLLVLEVDHGHAHQPLLDLVSESGLGRLLDVGADGSARGAAE